MFGQLLLLSFGYLAQVGLSSCNYALYNYIPLAEGACQQIGSSSSGKLTCSGTSGTVAAYESTDCSGDSTDVTSEVEINCDNSDSCSEISISVASYDSTDCSGTANEELELVLVDPTPCDSITVDNSTVGYKFSATDSSITIATYNSTDCSGDAMGSMTLNEGCNEDDSGSTKLTFSAADNKYKTSILYVAVLFAALSTLMVAV